MPHFGPKMDYAQNKFNVIPGSDLMVGLRWEVESIFKVFRTNLPYINKLTCLFKESIRF